MLNFILFLVIIMNSNSENSSNLSDSDFDPPSDTEFPIDFEDEEIPTPSSPTR